MLSIRPGALYLLLLFALPIPAATAASGSVGPKPVDPFAAGRPAHLPSDAELRNMGAVIGEIRLERLEIFDTSQPEENKAIFRAANSLHTLTRASVIRSQLLFASGDLYQPRLLEESERILRNNIYLFDAKVAPVAYADGKVDVVVTTRDLWTLKPAVALSRSGGENRTLLGVEDQNFLGTGALLGLEFENGVDRDSSRVFFSDRQLGQRWVALDVVYEDNSDGRRQQLRLRRPFYALDTRWAGGVSILSDDREDSLYDLGDKIVDYRHDERQLQFWYGWSAGLTGDWTRRWRAGLVSHESAFGPPQDPIRSGPVPENRKLNYPYISFELLENRFAKTKNHDQIDRTEDFFLGTQITAGVGLIDESFGSDRDAWLVWGNTNRGFGHPKDQMLLVGAQASGRIESGHVANGLLTAFARYYRKQSKKRLLYMTLHTATGSNLDLDNPVQLGGDTGLRGYPVRYQSGDSSAVFSIEQRYFTDWYPWHLMRVGGAIFADVGRTWGDNPAAGQGLGLLRDIGFGLRLAMTRGGSKVVHIDVAFPLDGDDSIDSVQINVNGRRSF